MKKSVISLLVVVALLVTALAVTAVMAGAEVTENANEYLVNGRVPTFEEDGVQVMKHCLCGNVFQLEDGTVVQRAEACVGNCKGVSDGDIKTWEPFNGWVAKGSVSAEKKNLYYYFTGDITLTGAASYDGGNLLSLNLDLNGYTITTKANERFAYIYGNRDLSITDSSLEKNGSIVGNGTKGANGGLIFMQGNTSGSTARGYFFMYGGTLSGGKATGHGGNVAIQLSNARIYGGTIQNGSVTGSDKYGGNIYVWGGAGSLQASNCTISGGTATGAGGNIGITAAAATLTNVTLTGGVSGSNGGSIYSEKNITLNNCSVSGGQAVNGGNIYAHANAITLTGTSVTNGVATGNGGNISIRSDYALKVDADSTISGGQAAAGSAVYLLATASYRPVAYIDLAATISGEIGGNTDLAKVGEVRLYDTDNADYAVTGNTIQIAEGLNVNATYTTGDNTYITLKGENNTYSAHRVEMEITKVYLRAAFKNAEDKISPAIYYEVSLKADATLKGEIDAFGVIATQGETLPTSITAATISDEFASGFVPGTTSGEEAKLGTLITNIMTEGAEAATNVTNAGTAINAAPYVKIGDTLYFGTEITENNTLADYITAAYAMQGLSDAQGATLKTLAEKFGTELQELGIIAEG